MILTSYYSYENVKFSLQSYFIISFSGNLGFIHINRLGAPVIYLTCCARRHYDNALCGDITQSTNAEGFNCQQST